MAAPPGILEVRCAGCGETLEVEHGLTEFACPGCGMAQSLPPELMPPRPRRALPLPGRVAPYAAPPAPVAPARVTCGGCGSVLSVPHGPGRFACPLCGAELVSSPLAAIPVVTTPAAVPISSTRLPNHRQHVQHGPLNQSARAGIVEKPIRSEQSHGQHPKQYLREESFSSFRADSRTQANAVGRLQNESHSPLVHREKSHTEAVQRTIAMPGKKKYRFVFGPKSWQEGNVQEEHLNQVVRASQAQVIPTKSSVHANQTGGGFPHGVISMHNKQATGHVASPSAMEHEQITSQHPVVHEQQAGEIPSDIVQSNQVVRASQAQVIPKMSSVHASQTEGGFPYDTIPMHNKQATEHVAAPSAMEHEQITSQHPVVHEQQAGEIPSDTVEPNQVVSASQAQVIPAKSSVDANQKGGFPYDTISMHNKQATEHVAAPSAMEHEQITSRHRVVHEQQGGEILSDAVQAEQEKVDSACKQSIKNKTSTENTKGNRRRKNRNLMNDPNEWSHLRRSKRLSKGSPDFIDIEPIQRLDASPLQNHSEAPQIESTIADPASSSPTRYQCPQAGCIELDNIDVTPAPTLSHGALQAEQSPHCYSQTYSPETRWVLLNPSSNSWHEHEIPQKSFNAIDQLDKSDDEVCLNPSENQNHIDGQLAEAACNGKNYSEQVQVKPPSKKFADHGRQMNLAASCSRLAAMLPVPAATTSTISSLPSLEKLPLECSSPTMPQHQPRTAIYSQEAQCDDMQSGSLSKSSKKRRGRPPTLLMEPRIEADRPVLTPNGTDWSVHPPGPKVVTTLSLLIKQNYPGTCISVDSDGRSCEVVVHYWHQYPPDVRATVLAEFLKRYKWSPGQEEECEKIFERKAIRQLVNLFCYEKQRIREELAANRSKKSSTVGRASGEMALEKGDGTEVRLGDESVVLLEHDDPRSWKPFVPDWLQPIWWEMLCDHWAKDEFMKVSYQKRKNRNAGSHPCDAEGSRSTITRQQDMTYQDTEEASDTPLGPHPVQEQVGSSKRGRLSGTPAVSKEAQTDLSSRSSPDCLNKQGQQPRFTRDQVQQMINQALQGLNETWEKKFLSLEQNMHIMSSSRVVPAGGKRPVVAAAARDKQCQLARQDTLDSVEGEKDVDARDEDGENQGGHWR
ncbi:uncharacterized protein LOC124669424 [Lolium rigidum]|uniref:uncharacterized protein LOC124669424 n=1 Tax=Lolium rigidum TaxID=89674 RepID=UPI001F5C9D01|nr:uncharacterized protein LOC124669424 [Lolium rigidum]